MAGNGFEHDIFISYSHTDNQPLTQGQQGWIDDFHRALQTRLSQLLGQNARLWRDPKLKGNDYFDPVLHTELGKTALLVSVLSPQYMNSTWCMEELNAFCKAAEASGGIRVGDQSRIFKVLKLPVPPGTDPLPMRGLLGYEFYEQDTASGAPREFSPEFGPAAELRFVQRVNDLAFHLEQFLRMLRPAGPTVAQPAQPSGVTVYLADTSYDVSSQRDQMRRELEQHGHRVLPDRALPLTADDFRRVVRDQLQQSDLSIHLIGANYGIVPEGETESVVALQHRLAMERKSQGGVSRLIWMPDGLVGSDDRQKSFIDYLRKDAEVQAGADLLQTSIEDLKTTVHDTIAHRQDVKANPAPQPTAAGPARVYLICDQLDRDASQQVSDYLFDQGFEVTLPAEDGDEAAIRDDHQQNLLLADAVMVFVGKASELWLRAQLRELLKAPGYGRTRPFAAKAIYFAPPEAQWKQRFRTHDAAVIGQAADFAPAVLSPFVDDLSKRGRVA